MHGFLVLKVYNINYHCSFINLILYLDKNLEHVKDQSMTDFMNSCKRGGLCTTGFSKISVSSQLEKHLPNMIQMVYNFFRISYIVYLGLY